MTFVTQSDIEIYIDPDELAQIVDTNVNVVPEAISDSEEYVAEMLRNRFDIVLEFAKIGTERNRQLLKQTVAIAIFYINERLNTDVLPESREFAYERAVEWLKSVQEGHRQTTLEQLDPENQRGFTIRWGNKSDNSNNFM